jgi:hypothetical protein
MGKFSKTFAVMLTLIIAVSCLTLAVKPANAQTAYASSTPSVKPTPYQLLPPTTIASPKNYTVPPLSSLNLNISLASFGGMLQSGGLIYVKGGSGNDINLRVIDPHGKTVLDLGRISNEKEFFITPYVTGNYTIILDNEFSVFSSKEVNVFSYTYPENGFEFVGFSINFLAIIVIVSIVVICLIVGLLLFRRHRKTTI